MCAEGVLKWVLVLYGGLILPKFAQAYQPCPTSNDFFEGVPCPVYEEPQPYRDYIDYSGAQLKVHEGQKTQKIMVLIHGFNGSPAVMDDLADAFFEKGFNTMNVQLPGHAESSKNMDFIRAGDLLDHVVAHLRWARQWGHELYIAGHSLGGTLAVLALEKVGNIKGLLLLDAALEFSPEVRREANLMCLAKYFFSTAEEYTSLKNDFPRVAQVMAQLGFGAKAIDLYPRPVVEKGLVYPLISSKGLCEATRLMEDARKVRPLSRPIIYSVGLGYKNDFLASPSPLLRQMQERPLKGAQGAFFTRPIPQDRIYDVENADRGMFQELPHGALPFRAYNPSFDLMVNQSAALFEQDE